MPSLPETQTKLEGGCFCDAVRYSISIPALKDRPLIPGALALPSAEPGAKTSSGGHPRWPSLEIDHCGSCRRACGSLVQAWIVMPLDWVAFSVLPRTAATRTGSLDSPIQTTARQGLSAPEVVRPSEGLTSRTFVASYSSNNASLRSFCARCGTCLTFFYSSDDSPADEEPVMDIAMGTLRKDYLEQPWMKPQRHCHWESGVPWIKDLLYKGTGQIPRHPQGLPDALFEEDRWMLQ